jgi:prevent-host-death family protein
MPSTEPISVRDFLRNFATIMKSNTKKRYIIMKHGKPLGVFTPWELQKKEMSEQIGDIF